MKSQPGNIHHVAKESLIDRTHYSKISPDPSLPSGPEALWAGGQRGKFLPFVKPACGRQGREGGI